METLDFVLNILILLSVVFILAGIIGMIWDTNDLKQENTELKIQIEKLRKNGGKRNEKKTK